MSLICSNLSLHVIDTKSSLISSNVVLVHLVLFYLILSCPMLHSIIWLNLISSYLQDSVNGDCIGVVWDSNGRLRGAIDGVLTIVHTSI